MDKESEEHVHNGIFWSKRKNEALLFGATWIELVGTMLSEIIQHRKGSTVCCILCIFLNENTIMNARLGVMRRRWKKEGWILSMNTIHAWKYNIESY
jgi:hypothetical protein